MSDGVWSRWHYHYHYNDLGIVVTTTDSGGAAVGMYAPNLYGSYHAGGGGGTTGDAIHFGARPTQGPEGRPVR
jgi:hypothetical protein